MNFKNYFNETSDPEKITSGLTCSMCGKKLDNKDLQSVQIMYQDTGKLCANCQKNFYRILNSSQKNLNNISNNIKTWGNREQFL